jgi:hypothetical protein
MSSPWTSPALEPITCQPWCDHGEGHSYQGVSEDSCCTGVEHRVYLSTEPTMLMSDGSMQQQHLNTHLLRGADDTASRVFIGHDDGFGKSATLDEARRFALSILARVDGYQV